MSRNQKEYPFPPSHFFDCVTERPSDFQQKEYIEKEETYIRNSQHFSTFEISTSSFVVKLQAQ